MLGGHDSGDALRRLSVAVRVARHAHPRIFGRIVEHATRLLKDETAYRAMATARNPYGDGYAAERIVQRIRDYFAADAATTASPALQPEMKELAKVSG